MEIGIIVHSLTGNTLSVAERLQERLVADGHDVEIEQLKTIGEENTNEPNNANIKLKAYPDPQAHDLLIIAGPVRGASASPVLKHYFSRISQFENKPTLLFVTEFFPFPWMGGKNALNKNDGTLRRTRRRRHRQRRHQLEESAPRKADHGFAAAVERFGCKSKMNTLAAIRKGAQQCLML